MVDYKYFDLFYKDNTNKQAKIEYSGGVMSNIELFQNSEELTESLCSEKELQFGCCEASSFKFKVANIVKPLIGETVTFSIVIDHHEDEPFLIGKYKVASDKETADRRYREVMAYDAMYDILNADVAAWYNSVLPNEDSTVTLKQFRESFVRHFGLTEVLPKDGLVNDTMTMQKTIQPEQISGKDVITAICEINGCFGHIGRDGKFHYIYLPQAIEGLYPANDLYPDHAPEWMAQAKTGHLYPQDPKTTRIGKGSYIPPCNYESYRTKPITKIQIRQEENDIGKIWPETPLSDKDNCYIIQDNFLVYGKSSDELSVIAQNILGKITDIIYRPFDCKAVGNPCLEVGDPVRLNTKYEIVESYILTRTMKGIQALRDTYKSNGVEKYAEDVNGIHRSIIQLKGKTNEIFKDVEKTQSKITDVEKGLTTTIAQTAAEIRGELNNVKDGLENQISITAKGFEAELKNTKEGLETSISATAGEIRTDMAATYETKHEASETKKVLQSSIEQTADGIRQNVSANYETKEEAGKTFKTLQSSIEQTADGIIQQVSGTYETKTESGSKYNSLQSSIEQTAEKIETKVNKGDLSSEISQEAGKIHIAADRLSIDSTNFSLSEEGEINSVKGTIGGFTLTDNSFGTDDDIISLHKGGDWAIRVGEMTEFGDPGKQYQFCVGHEGNVYCHGISVHEDMHIWGEIYREDSGGVIALSDKRLKTNISPISKRESADFIYSLIPSAYHYKNGTSGRLHHGLIAQEVKSSMGGHDWGVYVEHDTSEGTICGLRYEELIADLIATVQTLNERLKVIEEGKRDE